MSRMETDTFINDRYQAIEDRLQVSSALPCPAGPPPAAFGHRLWQLTLTGLLPAHHLWQQRERRRRCG